MKNDRFELEQQILDCWHVTDDLEVLFEGIMDKDISRDTIANIVLGLQELYHLKFERTFNTFENCIRNKQL